MGFTLNLEISGLCLLVRKTTGLQILLPVTHDGDHKHYPRLGSDKKYQPSWASSQGKEFDNFFYHDLGRKSITFNTKPRFPTVDTEVQTLDVLNLPCANGVLPEAAYVQINIPHGRPDKLGNRLAGACWTQPWLDGSPVKRLSTLITWTMEDLDNTVSDGSPGLTIDISAQDGTMYEMVVRPVEGIVDMFLHHTLEDEAPWLPVPKEKIPPQNNVAPHFHHYLELLATGHTCATPEFYGMADQTGACVKWPPEGTVDVLPVGAEGSDSSIAEVLFSESRGRRYSCLLATTAG